MQASFTKSAFQNSAPRSARSGRRSIAVRATGDERSHPFSCERLAAAVGAALLMATPFNGSAIARPSDFIQSKPSASPGQPTNVDKFPYNPSSNGNIAKSDTGAQSNPQNDPKAFSTLSGLPGVQNDDPMPSPTETGPNAQEVGK